MGSINVDTGKVDKEFTLNRGSWCTGCAFYFDEEDTVCKRGCKNYLPPLKSRTTADELIAQWKKEKEKKLDNEVAK